jgi:Zn-dependent protease
VAAFSVVSIRGIRVRIDQSWFIAFLLFAWTLSIGYYPLQAPDYSRFTYWLVGSLSSLLLFVCVFLHELSHCIVARQLGIPVRQITLFIFGGVSEMDHTDSSSAGSEFRITIAGPLASFVLAMIFMTAAIMVKGSVERITLEMLHYLYYVNFLLAAFNLIPGFPLDGGRVLRSYLWSRTGDLARATRSAARVGELFAITIMGMGVFAVLMMHIVPGVWLLLVGLFLKNSAEREYRSFELRFGLQDFKLREVMVPPTAVTTSMTISEFINHYVFHYHYRTFPVLENDRFVGMIEVKSIRAVPTEHWEQVKIGGYLSDPSTFCVLSPDMEATDALRTFVTRKCSKAAVVHNGQLLGMLTPSDLFRLISLKRDIAA